jgi:hypothetical protein
MNRLLLLGLVSAIVVALLLGQSAMNGIASIQPALDQSTAEVVDKARAIDNSTDERNEDIERNLPGFGGAFFDKDGVMNVYMVPNKSQSLDPTTVSAKLTEITGTDKIRNGVKILEGNYTFTELNSERMKLRQLFNMKLGVTSLDVDETKNIVTVGISDMSKVESVKQEMAKLGVSSEKVQIIEGGTIVLDSHTGTYRPTLGGV